MVKYKTISFSDGETFHYELIEKKIFATGEQLGYWDMYTPDGKLVAKCRGSIVSVLPGYMWDGSTVVGEYYEDEVTMEASTSISFTVTLPRMSKERERAGNAAVRPVSWRAKEVTSGAMVESEQETVLVWVSQIVSPSSAKQDSVNVRRH